MLLSVFLLTEEYREIFIISLTFFFFWAGQGWKEYSAEQKMSTAISGLAFIITKLVIMNSPYYGLLTIFLFPIITKTMPVNNVQKEVRLYRTFRTLLIIAGVVLGFTI